MYLEKLKIQGFKSFANKNVLVFPGAINSRQQGITAIVGPNGSGKSNLADAVRWALGEQSMKALRGKKGEDIIFSGSDKKGRLGMSEVSLFLNNSDQKTSIEYSQIILTRRLYRNGDSEYLINNSRARLADIQMLLAKANFGQKTYSVIGQGMVEGFLNTSLTERKEFFDEATGVKQFQIKRDESLNKLRLSHENLEQVNLLLTEIKPRLKSLTRQANKLEKRKELETELGSLQFKYYSQSWHNLNNKFNKFNHSFLELEKIKRAKEKKMEILNNELEKLGQEKTIAYKFNQYQEEISRQQNNKDGLVKKIALLEAQTEVNLEAHGKFDLSWMHSKKEDFKKQLQAINQELGGLKETIGQEEKKLAELEKDKRQIDDKIKNINNQLFTPSDKSGPKKIYEIGQGIKGIINKIENLPVENKTDVDKIKYLIKEIKTKILELIGLSDNSASTENLNELHNKLIKVTAEKEKILLIINQHRLNISSLSEKSNFLNNKKEEINNELANIEKKLSNSTKIESKNIDTAKKELSDELSKIETNLNDIKAKLNKLSSAEDEQKNHLLATQKNIQSLQAEINEITIKLNELKVNSARQETKLEDLELEIRHNFGELAKIRENKAEININAETTLEKINSLKRQLDLIGGIDPEVAREFEETKERYDFLSGQTNDLTKAINSLEKIIKELDLTIKERFDKEFKIISAKFEKYFKILFNGGAAKIIKIIDLEENGEDISEKEANSQADLSQDKKNDDGFNIKKIKFLQKHNATGLAGIEIQATPPGKKIKSISMLSGGERALTAIALICAIISANPSPFVVLDEVDAALDEANSERLAKILDDLSSKTQFITITHNRATMRRAHIIYGVTMGDDGISKLLSLKLEEAKNIK